MLYPIEESLAKSQMNGGKVQTPPATIRKKKKLSESGSTALSLGEDFFKKTTRKSTNETTLTELIGIRTNIEKKKFARRKIFGKSNGTSQPSILSPDIHFIEVENIEVTRKLMVIESKIQEARISFRNNNVIQAKEIFTNIITKLEKYQQPQPPTLQYAIACCYYFASFCDFTVNNFDYAEACVRQSLEYIDNLILNKAFKNLYSRFLSEEWILGVEINLDLLWLRRSDIEHLVCFYFS